MQRAAALGFERVTPNDLRRTFRFLAQAEWRGVLSRCQASGTTSRMVELGYAHLDGGAMAQAMGELPELGTAVRRRKVLRRKC